MKDYFEELRENIKKQKEMLNDLKMMNKINESLPNIVNTIPEFRRLKEVEAKEPVKETLNKEDELELKKFEQQKKEIEKKIFKRIKEKKKKEIVVKSRKPSNYLKVSNNIFSNMSSSLYKKRTFQTLKQELIHANISILPISYISIILSTTTIVTMASIFVFLFFLFFNLTLQPPFIEFFGGDYGLRILKTCWIIIVFPVLTFGLMYLYPSMEKSSIKRKINQELPFVTIHMSAISGSMLEPSKMFEVIMSTKEYPTIEKEFTKIINEVNIYGYDLVSALRQSAANTASEKLSDLFNGLATTITSGGDLQKFFEKRAQSFLFDYRLEREKFTRTAETFMDIYISVVIAAPMILMLLLIMIKVSGLGISLSVSTITLLMVIGVIVINVIFLTFLQLKQPES